MEKITGSELVKRVLKDLHGSVEKLLQLSSRTETDWLELKASTLPEFSVENGARCYLHKKDTNDGDYAWHVVKAIVAMANTHGGAVILGIDDNLNAVGLEASDKKGELAKGEDNFARCVLDHTLRPENRCWKCAKETYDLTVSTYYELLEYQFADYQDKRVGVIIVNPVPKDGKLILVEETRKFREELLVRAVGETGKVRCLFRSRDIEEYGMHRDPCQESYALLHEQFLASCPKSDASEHSEPQGLKEAVDQYHGLLRRMCAEDDRLFIPLDAEENPSVRTDMELFEPMAEEYLSSDLDWLDDQEGNEETIPSSRRKREEAGDKTDAADPEEDGDDTDDFDEITRIARKGGVFSLLEQEPRAMLLGEPGGGKTTCLKHLSLRAANQFSENKRVSLFVPLSRYKGPGDLMPLIVRATRSSKTDTGLTLAHIEWLMKSGRLQLLLDALNECPSEYTRHCVEDIQSCLNRYPSLPVTITARTYAYREQIGLPAFSVQPMDVEQQNAFLAVHLRSKERAQDIIAQLQQQAGGETLASNPLLLRLVVETVRGGQPLPTGRARLYRQFLERWYIREANKAKSAGRPLPWAVDQTLAALSQLAFQTRLAGLRSVNRDQAVGFLHDVVADPTLFIDRMAQGLVLTCDFEGMIDFLHETFQEYLAAEFLIQNPESIKLIQNSEKDKWSMTLAYTIELNPSPPPSLLEEIAKLDLWIAACAGNAHVLLRNNPTMDPLCREFVEIRADTETTGMAWPGKRYLKGILTTGLCYLIEALSGTEARWTSMTARFLRGGGLQHPIGGLFICLVNLRWPGVYKHQELIVSSVVHVVDSIELVKAGWAKPDDFKHRVSEWANSVDPNIVIRLVKAGWAKPDDFKHEETVFLKRSLQAEQGKQHAIQVVRFKIYSLTVTVLLPPKFTVGFVRSREFPDGVYLNTEFLGVTEGLGIGDCIAAKVDVKMNKKRNEWGFVVKKYELLKKAESAIPHWWQAWDYFSVQFVLASRRGARLGSTHFQLVEKQGLAVEPLKTWIPAPQEAERLRQAILIMNRGIENGLSFINETRETLNQILEGNGHWEILQKMGNARLDGWQGLHEVIGAHSTPIDERIFDRTPENIQTPRNPKLAATKSIASPAQKKEPKGKSSEKSKTASIPVIASRPIHSSQLVPQVGQHLFEFGRDHAEFTVYIDEAWPGNVPNATKPVHEGVIAGLICYDPYVSNLLPKIKTHSYQQPEKAKWALSNLLKCDKVFPFIFPIGLIHSDDLAVKHYDKLFQHAISLLLGWTLPRSDVPARVSIIAERIGNHHPGDEQSDFFRGLLHHERYRRWIIDKVYWEDKNFGYLPYADLLAHLTHEHTDRNRKLGREFRYKELPGYVPLSLKLVPMLERLEHLESIGNVEDALDLLLETHGTRFGNLARQDLQRRIQALETLQEKLLLELEKRYQSKSRNLNELRRLFLFLKDCIKSMPDEAPVRMRLLWILLAFQDANHDGDPGRVQKTLNDYFLLREAALESDRELTAYTDLNMAIHFADRFEFAEAESTVRQWISDPLFPALSSRQRGRMYSSLGQFRSMQWDHDGADHFFGKALECFESPALTPAEKADEWDQSSVYRAINALDGGFTSALSVTEAVVGDLIRTAQRLASSDDPRTFYQHHLLVRTLYQQSQETVEARTLYLKERSRWCDDIPQHPWPLIHLYRGLLLWEYEEKAGEDFEWFGKAIACCDRKTHGGTLKLIGAMICIVASCCFEETSFTEKALEWLDEIQNLLPAAGSNITGFREILKAPSPERINAALRLLPFNYH